MDIFTFVTKKDILTGKETMTFRIEPIGICFLVLISFITSAIIYNQHGM